MVVQGIGTAIGSFYDTFRLLEIRKVEMITLEDDRIKFMVTQMDGTGHQITINIKELEKK